MSTTILPQPPQPKITRPSTRRLRREEIHAHWVLGENASITIGTNALRLLAGEQTRVDLGGLIITIEVPNDPHVHRDSSSLGEG